MASCDHLVADSDFTVTNLMEILAKNDKSYRLGTDPSKLKSNPTEKMISEGKGFASKIYSVTLETDSESYSVIVKVPSDFFMRASLEELNNETMQYNEEQLQAEHKKNRDMIAAIHNREVDFYEFAKRQVTGQSMLVKYFYGEHMNDAEKRKGVILMEDLSKKHLKDAKTSTGLSKNQVLVVIDAMTWIQARSVLHQEEVVEKFPICDALIHSLSKYTISCAQMLQQNGIEWFSTEVSKKVQIYAQPQNMKALLVADPKLGDIGEVIVHGDLWEGNMLWEVQKKDKLQLLAIVDWQGCAAGSFATDLAVVMGVSMEPNERRACEKEILEYYMHLMNELSDKFVLPYELDFNTVHKAYKRSLIYAVLQMVLTVVTNPNDDVPEEGQTEGPLSRRLRCLLEDVHL
ncbi:hypothetical protein QR680_005865 [Steinernema hermaphroditum]|uniref:CHK kinase-like domain-containing protein n=1 Tax=Steinernema hermaphroditum TaxID=289476 RepID=A0AA39LWF6_9BILA|nr:hypothetical protein QR680_005865 [Steinernema hermaphroditum]